MAKRAFLSVWDKTGIVDFAKGLVAMGFEILSTGGTQRALEEAKVPVTNVSDITGFPECLDGRVKTLHPKIHAGILAMRDNPKHMEQLAELGVSTIDVVAVNLYPFKQTIMKEGVTLAEAIENIDIGGPTMLRAASKNWQDVAVIVDAADYGKVLEEMKNGGVTQETKFALAAKVFENTAAYDALIAAYLREQIGKEKFPQKLTLTFEKVQPMRYGENPHQAACFYKEALPVAGSLAQAQQLNGKELSYNNINDTNGALDVLREFQEETAVVAVKHANPCGVAVGGTVKEAYVRAYESDPVSIFGGIVVTNGTVDAAAAEEMAKIFLEIIVAPDYTEDALKILNEKKNLRVLKLPAINVPIEKDLEMKKVLGGLLVQDYNTALLGDELKVVTKRQPTEKELEDLIFTWKVVKHTKSNGIAIGKDKRSLGIGPGQVNRIWATNSAIERSGDQVKGAVMASDAFFPFGDCVEAAAKAGITAIIQPGGAMRDEESIKLADEHGIAMVFTGMRHFKH